MTDDSPPLRRYVPAAVMTLLIPVLSLLPAQFFRQVAQPLPPLPGLDKLVHACMYAALTAAYLQVLPRDRRGRLAAVLRVVSLAALYGMAMEICQKLMTASRAMDPLDALANLAGALVSGLLAYGWARHRANAGPGLPPRPRAP